jgi:hypothetical protein
MGIYGEIRHGKIRWALYLEKIYITRVEYWFLGIFKHETSQCKKGKKVSLRIS